jgi:ubiquinone/menaquinone biosynthesis C-methylase UbiE
MKDNFSARSANYAKYRPTYPDTFFEYLKTLQTNFDNCWDCGTGNGQVAVKLAAQFKNVYATDISQSQLDNAKKLPNIFYSLEAAEKTNFPNNFFDLVIVAQAVHWFNFNRFYAEVTRTAKNNALIVIIGYGLLNINQPVDAIINNFYKNIIGSYWDKERKYIDENYLTIPFPFRQIKTPAFQNQYSWTFEQLLGYISTWSAVQHYIKSKNQNPIDLMYTDLKQAWGQAETHKVNFPLLLRVGRIQKLNN